MTLEVQRRTSRHYQPLESATNPAALLRLETVIALTGLARSTVYAKASVGAFPQPVRLGARCTRWRAGDVTAWLEAAGKAVA